MNNIWNIIIKGGVKVTVPADLDIMTSYVLLEQEDWFEGEMEFVRRFVRSGMNCLDIGACYGVYARTMAHLTGTEGKIFAFEPNPEVLKYLEQGKPDNLEIVDKALSDNDSRVSLTQETTPELCQTIPGDSIEQITLDTWWNQSGRPDVELIKLDINGHEGKIISGGREFFSQNNPIIIFSTANAGDVIPALESMGYHICRFLPANAKLAKTAETKPDQYTLNLVAIKSEHEYELAISGLLQSIQLQKDEEWPDVLGMLPWTAELMPTWLSNSKDADYEDYINALNRLCADQPKEAATSLINIFGNENKPAWLVMSLSRALYAIGERHRAAMTLQVLVKATQEGQPFEYDLPFLPPLPEHDQIPVETVAQNWIVARCTESFLTLNSFSGYFSGERDLGLLKTLHQNKERQIEFERRFALHLLRMGKNIVIKPENKMLGPNHLNPAVWAEIAGVDLADIPEVQLDTPVKQQIAASSHEKIVVYTAIAGNYEVLRDPEYITPGVDYICFTDNPETKSEVWKILPLPEHSNDPMRRAKQPKILPHKFVGDYDISIWVDANMRIIGDVRPLAAQTLSEHDMAVFRHPFKRPNLEAEVQACIFYKKDSSEVLYQQLNKYREEGLPDEQPIPQCNTLLRRHNKPEIISAMDAWWQEIENHSRRDQMSFPYIAWKYDLQHAVIKDNANDNSFFKWRPHGEGIARPAKRAALSPADYKKITISLSYYNDAEHIEKHINKWSEYADLVKFQILDDGSNVPAEDILKNFDLSRLDMRLFRVEEDIPWNIPGIRNLGATVCSTPWMLICDMDQTFERSEIEKMCSLPDKGSGYYYSFARQDNISTRGTMLVSIEDYWKVGGYDEDMVGNYGYNDPLFRYQLNHSGIREITCKDILCTQHTADCDLDRSTKEVNAQKMAQKITELPRQNWDVLRFKWKQVPLNLNTKQQITQSSTMNQAPMTTRRTGPGPKMHCHAELLRDLNYQGFIPDETMMRWFNDRYSTSKHLLTLYSIARGLNALKVVEIGFGRSSFVLARAAHETGGSLITCDTSDFSYLLSEEEKKVVKFINGDANLVWEECKEGIDFAFLDFFSMPTMSKEFSLNHITQCVERLKQNAVLALHDSIDNRFKLKGTLATIADHLKSKNIDIELIHLPYNYGLCLIRRVSESHFGMVKDQHVKKPESKLHTPPVSIQTKHKNANISKWGEINEEIKINEDKPIFTICIPTFNRVEDLKRCLISIDSAVEYLLYKTEVIVSDNNSIDGTSDFLSKYCPSSKYIDFKYWTNLENIGIVNNVKKLLFEAKGKYIAWISDDDFFFPNALFQFKTIIDKYRVDFAKCRNITYMIKSDKVFLYGPRNDIRYNINDNFNNFLDIFQLSRCLSGCVHINSQKVRDIFLNLNNVYPSMALCALCYKNSYYTSEPLLIHQFENTIYLEKDVDMKTDETYRMHTARDRQRCLLFLPDDIFMNTISLSHIKDYLKKYYNFIDKEVANKLQQFS
ncbi:FkbM family methyltransferase [Desulfonatronovibrio magnus]|uniref:FkbM family methyltransferase n=1 Tax=Desulfonatronovibrio magnus TaxID=698827 RepID=UPI0005EB56D0|nr:FkbM family methyltransferase [Desulfonatronovibrio magnus]